MKFGKVVLPVFAVLVLATMVAYAADLTGTWKSKLDTPQGSIERTFTLKQDGGVLTGKIVTVRGENKTEAEIKDGKVKGDEFEFTVEQSRQGQTMTVPYKGKVDGDTLKGTMGLGDRAREWTATKQK